MNEVGQGAGAGARIMLLVVLAAIVAAWLLGAPAAGAATGSLASIERDPNFAWSALNITAGGGFVPVADDPIPWKDAATGQLCAVAITPTPAGHVVTWCRTSDNAWHQWDMTALWGGPAGVGDVREVASSGQSALFYRDASGEMWSLTRSADGTWTPVNLTGTYGFAALASDPWPLIDAGTGQLCAVAAASSPAGHVTEWCHQSNGAWLQFDLTSSGGAPAAVGTVVPGTDPATNQNVDFFRDASGELWSLTRQAGGAWVALNITARSSGLSPLASDPMPVIDPPTGQLCVTATLASPVGHVAALCRQSSGSWLQLDLTALYGGGAATGDVQPLVDAQLNQTALYFRDAGGNLWSLTRGADGRWTPAQIVASGGTPMLISEPEPLVDPQTNEPVVLVSGVTPPSTPAPPVTVTTPAPGASGTIRARFVLKWRWDGQGTVLRSVRVRGLPPRARVAVSCTGPGCPHIKGRATGRRRIAALLERLAGQRFAPGDVMGITVTARGLRRERIQLRIRRQRVPMARLLKS